MGFCDKCNISFKVKRSTQRFCSKLCRVTAEENLSKSNKWEVQYRQYKY